LNVAPDLSHFAGIVPCGLLGGQVTSLQKLGVTVTMQEVDTVLRAAFAQIFSEPRC
jgi:lipoyl(octanoyl) transferase